MKYFTNNTKLNVTDFGPISKAEIDLRPLTVFLGPSNAGKSYLAILIYALHRSLGKTESNLREEMMLRRGAFYRSGRISFDSDKLTKSDVNELIMWAKGVSENFDLSLSLKSRNNTKKQSNRTIIMSDTVVRLLKVVIEKQVASFRRELNRCFAMESVNLNRKKSKGNAKISITNQASIDSVIQSYELIFNPAERKSKAIFSKEFKIDLDEKQFRYFTDILTRFLRHLSSIDGEDDEDERKWQHKSLIEDFFSSFANVIHYNLIGSLSYPAFYLPADRTGIMHAHNVVVSALIQNATMAGIRHANPSPTLSGVLADFIEGLISINHRMESRRSKHIDYTHKIEKILDGQVHIEEEHVSNYPRFTYQPEGWTENLSLMNSSSMVSELAPVVFYLRYKVHPGNVLIVEEPESHLHPAKQVDFINALADLVKSGFRVIITTHSQWILEGLSNIVQRSELEQSEKESDNDKIALTPEMVGVWLFKKNAGNGSSVEEIKFDEYKMYSSDFDVVATNLHNDWVDLINNGRRK